MNIRTVIKVINTMKDEGAIEHYAIGGEALAKATSLKVEDDPVSVMTAEHLAAIALELGSPKDKARLLQFLDEGGLNMTLFEEILTRYQLTQKWLTFQSQFLSDQ